VALIGIGSYFYKAPISKNEINEFGTVVKTEPRYLSGGHGHKSIEFKISDCKYEVQIEDEALEALGDREQFLNDVSIGDSIYISVSNWDYQNIILRKRKKRPLTGTLLHIYTFRSNNNNYVDVTKYNHYKKKDEFFGVLIGAGLFILVVITIIKKVPLSTFLEKNWWIMLVALVLTLIYSWYVFKI
jgi:hypothetical protein